MLHRDQARRLVNFCAQHNHQVFEIAQAFSDELAGAFPRVRAFMPLATKAQRFEFAVATSDLVKNLGNLDSMAPVLAALGDRLSRAGFGPSLFPHTRTALFAALRRHAGSDWTAQIEHDWTDALAAVLNGMSLQPALPIARRLAVAA